jgi:hypothetical protein
MPWNRPMPEKCGITVNSIFPGCFIFAHIQVVGQGRSGGRRETAVSTKQGKNLFTAKLRLFICCLSASQTSEHFLPEVKDVAFCEANNSHINGHVFAGNRHSLCFACPSYLPSPWPPPPLRSV